MRNAMISPARRFLFLGGALALTLGCKVGPTYEVPKVPQGRGWSQGADPSAPAGLEAWWRSLGDPVLDRLVERALAGNLDIRSAQQRIQESRALRDAAAGNLAPKLEAQAGVTRERQSMNGVLPIAAIPVLKRDLTIHDVGFDMAWELDLFGRTRRSIESAQAQTQASEEAARDARISVAAEVARTYLTLRGAQRELAARSAQCEALGRILEITRLRAEAGDLAKADVEWSQGLLHSATAALPPLRAQMRASALGLGVLLGQLPESELGLLEDTPREFTLAPIPVGERADILRRRPDVRAAERQLASATADVGVARAEWFPKLSISASAGFEALKMADLFKSSSQALSVAPFISWRIFDGGTIRAQIRVSESRQAGASLAYEKAVLSALGDAERSLSNYRLALESVQAQGAVLASARRTYRHSEARFKFGDISLGDLLETERTVREAEDGFARTHTEAAVDLVALYKALGGGW